MTMQDVLDEIKLELTGNVLETEIDESTLEMVVKKALREITRYWDETSLITVPFASCIDLTKSPLDEESSNAIVGVYRANVSSDATTASYGMQDPAYAQQWMIFSNAGTTYTLTEYMLDYAAWSTVQSLRNTMSTELSFKEDRHNNKLYINNAMYAPQMVTIEYIPKLTSVEQIKDEYWCDLLIQFSVALTKIILGRIRTRYTQSNALWTQDGEKLLQEGTDSLKELRDRLRENDNLLVARD